MVKFKTFLNETKQDDYSNLLDEVAILIDTVVGEQLVYVKKEGETYIVIEISGEDYVESKITDGDQKVIKTSKLYKDGEIVNYDLAISRLKEYKNAIKNEQFLEMLSEEKSFKEKEDMNKLMKVINSIENEGQAETAERMIDNWGKLHSKGKALTFGRTVFDVYGDVRDLKTMLNNIAKKKGIKYKADNYRKK